jgi:hypothetical protein
MVKIPKLKHFIKYYKDNMAVLLTGIGLGFLGAYLYLQRISRESVIEITSRSADLGTLTPTPESQVYAAFIITGIMAALIVSGFVKIGGK